MVYMSLMLGKEPSLGWTLFCLQRSPPQPDVMHKTTCAREPRWLDCQYKPAWVNCRLGTLKPRCSLLGLQSSSPVGSSSPPDKVQSLCEEGHLDKELETMDQHGGILSENMYTSLLKACTKRKALAQAKRVHSHLAKHGLESRKLLGEAVVSALVKCGGLDDALEVFYRLPARTVLSWTAVISGYTMNGQGQEALRMYKQMQEEGVQPNTYTFVSLLKACGRIPDLNEGKRMHAEARKYSYESDVFVATCLVDMYAKCGSILAAQNVFEGLPQRNVVSWTTMLTAYAQHGLAEKALQLFEQMRAQGISPDVRTYVSVIQACGMLAEKNEDVVIGVQPKTQEALEIGKAVHAEAWRKGYKSDVIIGNTLVTMYGKCGNILAAQEVFDELSNRSVVSWNSIIVAYTQQGEAEKGLQLYEQMREENMTPNDRTFVSVLQACSMLADKEEASLLNEQSTKVKSLGKGKVIHAAVQRKGYGSDVFIGNTLIGMYGKCGSILDAQHVFDRLSRKSLVSWNAMLAVYTHLELADEALRLYYQMLEEGVTPNDRTFVSVLQACGMFREKEIQPSKVNYLGKGREMHAEVWRKGYASDVPIGNTLVSMYGKCGSIVDAQNVFDGLSHRSVVSWNVMLAAFNQQGQEQRALDLYEQMYEVGVSPNNRTFVSALQACGILAQKEGSFVDGSVKVKSLRNVKALHGDAWRRGHASDVFIASSLITMYGKCGSTDDAQDVFDKMAQRSVVLWNSMLSSYVEQGLGEKVLQLYKQMQEGGVSPNDITIVCILQACSHTGSLDVCRQIHRNLVSTRKILSLHLGNTLIHAYGRCASTLDASNVFDALPQRDVISWNALTAAYVRQGDFVASLQCYEKMQLLGEKPNGVTFLSLLSACSHAGLVGQGVEYFESMTRDHGLCPEIEHYVSMVDLLGRAGYFSMVEDLLSTMPVKPNLSLWLCLLGACRNHGRILLGKKAFDCAITLEPSHASAYVLMSNLYAHVGLWDHANEIHELRQMAGAWKKPGQSWIGHDQSVHSFVVDDHKHPQQEQLYNHLEELNWSVGMTSIIR